jgi:predicted RNA-binding Zn-ribbon protein involved in translation (DUF1610 family)
MSSLNANNPTTTSGSSFSTGKYMALTAPLGPAVSSTPTSNGSLPTASPGALHGQAVGTTWDHAAAAAAAAAEGQAGGGGHYGAEFASAGGYVPGYHAPVVLGPNGIPMTVFPHPPGVMPPPGTPFAGFPPGPTQPVFQGTIIGPTTPNSGGGGGAHEKKRSKKSSHPYQCSICLECFNRPARVREHLMSKHNVGERIPCPRCDETFVRKENLRKHMARAHNEKPT